jgi:hypothetical protein
MDILDYLQNKWNIDIYIVLIVLLSGFFQKSYFKGFRLSKSDGYDEALKTLGLSFIIGMIYVYLAYVSDKTAIVPYNKYFVSYFAATSIYELIINPFRKAIIKKFGGDDETPIAN